MPVQARVHFEQLQDAYHQLVRRASAAAELDGAEKGDGDWRSRLDGLASRREEKRRAQEHAARVRAAVRERGREHRGSVAAFYSTSSSASVTEQLKSAAAAAADRIGKGDSSTRVAPGTHLLPAAGSAERMRQAADLAEADVKRFLRLARLARAWRGSHLGGEQDYFGPFTHQQHTD
jgi:hypothetical protein